MCGGVGDVCVYVEGVMCVWRGLMCVCGGEVW